MSSEERKFHEKMARQVGNCSTALSILASQIDTPLADALHAIGDLLERIEEDMTIAAEAAE